jgi:hypothetical protein
MGYEVCWRITSLSGDVVCTIYHKEVDVEVQAAFSNGIVVRTRRTSNIETGRIIAARWLDAILRRMRPRVRSEAPQRQSRCVIAEIFALRVWLCATHCDQLVKLRA